MTLQLEDIQTVAPDHTVYFHDGDQDLAETVAEWLAEGVRRGGTGVVIATAAHREAIGSVLRARGVEPAAAAEFLDAATTLSAFTSGGRIDRERFRAVIGPVIERAGQGGRPVWAFGEMVALLWDVGDVPSVMALEGLWNELAQEVSFSLLCAYPSASVRAPGQAEALACVCELHAGEHQPLGRATTSEFPAAAGSPGAARRFVDRTLERWGIDGPVLEHVRLITSELATNAVVHAAGRFAVTVRATRDAVRIAVDDASLSEPVTRSRPPGAPAGRGMYVIAALAQEWGVEVTAHGKRVWADVPLSG